MWPTSFARITVIVLIGAVWSEPDGLANSPAVLVGCSLDGGGVGMNIAGALGYLLLEGSPIDPDAIAGALDTVADEPVDREVRLAVASIAESISALFRPVRYDELRATGRTGLLSLNLDVLAQALADSPDGPPQGDRSWAKAVEVGDDALVYPQDRRPEVRLVLWAPVAVGPAAVRLTPVDLGNREWKMRRNKVWLFGCSCPLD